MKRTKLLTSIATLTLIFTLGACTVEDVEEERIIVPGEYPEDDETTEDEIEAEMGEVVYHSLFGAEVDGTLYFAAGKMSINNDITNGSITDNIDDAPAFTLTETNIENAYYLSCEIDGVIEYLYFPKRLYAGSNNPLVVGYTEEPTLVYYDEEHSCFTDKDGTHYFAYKYGYLYTDYIANDNYSLTPFIFMDYPSIESLTISGEESVVVDYYIDLDVSYSPSNIHKANLEWTSSDEDVAIVENGRVTGIGEGSATITAKSKNGVQNTFDIKVSAKTGETVTKTKIITNDSLKDDLNVFAGDNISTLTSSYEGFDISWNPNGDETSPTQGIFIRNEVTANNYVRCIYVTNGQNFTIIPDQGASINKITIIGCSQYGTIGCSNIGITNCDYNSTPEKLDDHYDKIETNITNTNANVVVSNIGSIISDQVNIYSIAVEYSVVM